ncbi:MAG: hypothetical protein P8P30_09850 [Rickettsiales bacterium]|nr:hypothetical protein [Rickettsiales bacterium]
MKLLITLFTLILWSASAQAAVCAKPAEFQALNMRALQSELMVAALSCGQKRQYNNFAKRYGSQLNAYGSQIINFFSRHGGQNKGDKLLNDFVTKMANRASRASLGRPQRQYCGEVASLYGALEKGHFNKVANLANRYYSSWHRVPICGKR